MTHKIRHRSFADSRALEVTAEGVVFTEATPFSNKRKFSFGEILCVLLSPGQMLSFQVGSEVFSVPIEAGNQEHRAAINALLTGVNGSQTVPPPIPSPCPTFRFEY
jgi:hypothetical protein